MMPFRYTFIFAAAAFGGFILARTFVRRRLRFVNAIQSPWAPWIVGVAAALIALPVAWVLPLVTKGAAYVFGLGSGLGTASGAKALKRGEV